MTGPRILTIDIETSPHLSWHFDTWRVNISPVQIVEPSRPVCFAAKWLDQEKVLFYGENRYGPSQVLQYARDLLDEADAVVTYNGDDFDLPRLQWGFDLHSIPGPSPFVSVDLYKVIKKAYRKAPPSKRLGEITTKLGLTGKLDTPGYWDMWLGIVGDDPILARKMWNLFRRYCMQDVRTTEELFLLEQVKVTNLPAIGLFAPETEAVLIPPCPQCPDGGSPVRQGYKRTKVRRYPRYQCQTCGRWYSDNKSDLGVTSA